VEKYFRVGQATDDNTAHAQYMLDTSGYKHTLRICNTCCFSIGTMAARTRLSVKFISTVPVLLPASSNIAYLKDFRRFRSEIHIAIYLGASYNSVSL
jgi:hypothetical protein